MKAVYLIVFLTSLIALIDKKLVAQEYYQASVRARSLAEITVCLSDSWSVFGNQAGLSTNAHSEVGISCSNYFCLDELALKAAYVTLPVDKNVFAVSFYRFGNETYNENKLGLNFSRELTPGFSVGFQYNYVSVFLPENKKSPGTYSFEGGIQYRLHDKFVFGMHCVNPFQSGIKTESIKYKLPCMFRFGVGTCVTDELLLYCEVEKDLKHELLVKLGIEYQILDKFHIRGGLAGKNDLLAFGLAYSTKRIKTDFSWQYNYQLGSTPSVAISYVLR